MVIIHTDTSRDDNSPQPPPLPGHLVLSNLTVKYRDLPDFCQSSNQLILNKTPLLSPPPPSVEVMSLELTRFLRGDSASLDYSSCPLTILKGITGCARKPSLAVLASTNYLILNGPPIGHSVTGQIQRVPASVEDMAGEIAQCIHSYYTRPRSARPRPKNSFRGFALRRQLSPKAARRRYPLRNRKQPTKYGSWV